MAKKRDVYYTVPGTRRAAIQRRWRNRFVSVAVGLVTAGLLAGLIYFFYRRS